MNRRNWTFTLTREDADRLLAVLARRGGRLSFRDLYRRHRFLPHVLEAAATAGVVAIAIHKPRTGRPSRMVVMDPDTVNKLESAKLPRRRSLPKGLTLREECFLGRYLCPHGLRLRGFPRGQGSAADAYRRAYGRTIPPGTARSAGARLARQPWIRVGILLNQRLLGYGRPWQYPADLRSSAETWLAVINTLDRAAGGWSARHRQIIASAHTINDAIAGILEIGPWESASPPST